MSTSSSTPPSSDPPSSDPSSADAASTQGSAAAMLATAKKSAEEAQSAVAKRVQEKLTRSKLTDARSGRKGADENNDPSTGDNPNGDDGTYRAYGRNLARTMGPFINVHPIVEYGVLQTLLRESREDSDEEVPAPTAVNEIRMAENWAILKAKIPKFADEMVELGGQRKLRKLVCMEIQVGMKGARSDDTASLKRSVVEYLLPPPTRAPEGQPQPSLPVLNPPIAPSGSKAGRGFVHPVTAKLLCPISLPAVDATYMAIQNGEKEVNGTQMPRFMYSEQFNPDDLEEGLLEGHTLRAAVKHIYQGPSAALQPDGFNRGKAGNAALNGVTSLTSRDIAYTACQTRFAMSSVQTWNEMDGAFNYSDFYWSIVALLAGEEGQEIIDKFNFAVFGSKTAAKKRRGPPDADLNDFDRLAAQRAAKRQRKEEEATAAAAAAATAVAAAAPAAPVAV
ncbi:hypothetical protein C8J57DRAFT_1521737 [Mycena rebaudengoi]|nr:hypothetical protein C8J57DRAFT_1521737 [Mycena rebaudengoi]